MSASSKHVGHPLEGSGCSPDKLGPSYPVPTSQLELSAYKVHVIANYFDAVKNNTSQLVRAIVFLWAVFIIPLILLCILVGHIDWMTLPSGWKWVTGIGCLGAVAVSAMDRRRAHGSAAIDGPGSTLDAVGTGMEGFGQIADQISAENADE